jgi:hypothetical protein
MISVNDTLKAQFNSIDIGISRVINESARTSNTMLMAI